MWLAACFACLAACLFVLRYVCERFGPKFFNQQGHLRTLLCPQMGYLMAFVCRQIAHLCARAAPFLVDVGAHIVPSDGLSDGIVLPSDSPYICARAAPFLVDVGAQIVPSDGLSDGIFLPSDSPYMFTRGTFLGGCGCPNSALGWAI